MSFLRSQHLAAFVQAATRGDEVELARLGSRHPALAQALAPLLRLAGGRPPAAVALQTIEQQSLLLTDDAREVFQMALRKLGYSGNTQDPKQIEAP